LGTTSEATYLLDVAGNIRNTTDAYFATSSGNVGVNTTSPDGKIHVIGPSSGNSPALLIQGAATLPLEFYDTSAGVNSKRWQFNTNSNIFFFRTLSDDRSTFTNSFGIFRAGNVTFGNLTNSGYQVDVQGTLRNTTDAYFATSSGNVGIGNTSPTSKLSVTALSSNTIPAVSVLQTISGAENQIFFRGGSAAGNYYDFTRNSSNGQLEIQGSQTSFNNIVLAPTSGNVGIGASPSYKLDVNGTFNVRSNYAYFGGDANTAVYLGSFSTEGRIGVGGRSTIPTAALTFFTAEGTNNFERMRITSAGDVGIGNISPLYKLDVSGTLRNTTSAYFATSSGGVGIGTTTLTSGVILNVAGVSEFRGDVYFGKSSATNHTSYYFNASSTNRGQIGYDATNQNFRIESTYGGSGSYTSITLWTGNAERFRISEVGNVGIGQTSFGTSATKTLAVSTGVAPTTSPADAFQMYSADITAGNAAAHFRTEGGAVIKLYQETTGVAAATFVQNSVNAVYEDSTFDGYTLKQIVKALRNNGLLA
jgi:hypothetical protein